MYEQAKSSGFRLVLWALLVLGMLTVTTRVAFWGGSYFQKRSPSPWTAAQRLLIW
jgi:hypothetical protein